MHIAIDDTYGPEGKTDSSFVTGDRRTHVAVLFPDNDVQDIRFQAGECVAEVSTLVGCSVKEFHFVDLYNRKSPWDKLPDEANLRIFEFFAYIYRHYKWPVLVQTIDARTLRDHGIARIEGAIEGLDLSNTADLSLFWLLIKIKSKFRKKPMPITLLLDEGRAKPGTAFGSKIFHDWSEPFNGGYASSSSEPLLQLADFIAFCINRSTHLSMKRNRSEVDTWFLNLVGTMEIDCEDLKSHKLPVTFSVADFDGLHSQDRASKGL
jgi:hypothetical protein